MSETKHISADELKSFMENVLQKYNVPTVDAEVIADVLISADKQGIDSHGIGRFKPIYIDRLDEGSIMPVTNAEVLKDNMATAVIDAHDGFGHVAGKAAMQLAIEKARVYGISIVSVKNSSHYGIAGYYAQMAADSGMIGITGTNARPSISPTFGVENMLGTNPLTVAVPSDEEFDFVLDCATSTTQRGKIEKYARENKLLPKGWVIDHEGNSSEDPKLVLDQLIKGYAALTPLGGVGEETGGYKGYGYATFIEILSSGLHLGPFMQSLIGKDENGKPAPYKLGHFFIAINVSHFVDEPEFRKHTGDILRALRGSVKAPEHDRIFTAGEKEYLMKIERKKTGIPMDSVVLNQINELKKRFLLK